MQSLGWHDQKIDFNHSDHSPEEDDEYPDVFDG
ncbi:hypothetical protein JGUZn3_19240 [Entomobacter blattae]|uniref:Uncharacterized protein n=1 Tax=Entomobacter blattae TaxID=2762277 RepID=A0A7H1NTM7_9PROT|nr:hypothetical protein JGUZn3_19240 [Entomobacter blattae]